MTQILRPHELVRLGLFVVAVALLALPTHAQDSTQIDNSADASANAETPPPPGGLEEIIITGNKKAQNIRDVPVSVSAVGEEDLEQKGISSAGDVWRHIPNFKVGATGFVVNISMRGLSNFGINKGFEQSTATIIDGVYLGRGEFLAEGFMDVGQVEILRGPQGTMTGKNASAGAVNITTKDPEHEFLMDGSAQFGESDDRRIELGISTPIVEDVLALRLSGLYHEREGWIENQSQNNNVLGTDRWGARAKLLFEPSASFSARLALEYAEQEQNILGLEFLVLPEQWRLVHSVFDNRIEGNFDRKVQQPGAQPHMRSTYGARLIMDYDGWGPTLTAVTGYAALERTDTLDADFGPAPILALSNDDEYMQLSQEFRITSEPATFEYLLGLSYFYADYQASNVLVTGSDIISANTVGTILPPALQGFFGDLLGNLPLPSLSVEESAIVFNQETTSYAGFGQLTWNITDALSLIGGARYTVEQKDLDATRTVSTPGLISRNVLNQTDFSETRDRRETDFSPRLSVTYKITDELTTFAVATRAFKSGGFNSDAGSPNELEFEPETAESYEAGIKGDLFGNYLRMSVTGFYTTFDNLQISNFNGTQFVVVNAATAITKGLEFEVTALPLPGLFVSASAGYLDATYDSFPDAPCPNGVQGPCDLSGKSLVNAPEWSGALSANWVLPLGNSNFGLMLGGEALYEGDHFTGPDLDPNTFQKAYWRFDGRVGLVDMDQRWRFIVRVENINAPDTPQKAAGNDAPLQSGAHVAIPYAGRLITARFAISL